MNIQVLLPIQVLDISNAGKFVAREKWICIDPGKYRLQLVDNPYGKPSKFFVLPNNGIAGAAEVWWNLMAWHQRIIIFPDAA